MPAAKTSKPKAAPAKTLGECIGAIEKLPQGQSFASAAALIEAAAPGTSKSVGQRVRELKRKAQEKVGRGKRYDGITPRELVALYKASQAQSKTTKDAAKATPKAKASKAKVAA